MPDNRSKTLEIVRPCAHNSRMTGHFSIQRASLPAILQQHFRRFVVSAEFVRDVDGTMAVDVVLDDGSRHRLTGVNNDTKNAVPTLTVAHS